MKRPSTRLYLVTPPAFEPAAFASLLARTLDAAQADSGGVAALRLRLPGADADTLGRATTAIITVAQSRGVALLMHGEAALARRLGCDGVHVPPRDVAAARALFGAEGSVGAGCGRSTDAAMAAAEAGADYVAFGPCTGADAVDPERVADWAVAMVVPCVAGGGLDATTLPAWAATGAEFLAVGRAVWDAPEGPESAIKTLMNGLK
ncbi:MAG: thiamine phosphate synthase [Alphaproteobacteria bacterium]|nr:thiamine phosphate synthase [Alphaproteobacteria bacterium]